MKIYGDRRLFSAPGVLFFLEFTCIPVAVERRTGFIDRDLDLCRCVECLNRTSARSEQRIEEELEVAMI
jgi:hypothetical protein